MTYGCRSRRTPQPFCPLCPVPEQDRATPEQIVIRRHEWICATCAPGGDDE